MAKKTEKDSVTRLAIVDSSSCKPTRCNLECKRACPVNKTGKPCITVTTTSLSTSISEILCIGCGACVKKCPFGAIKIINLPSSSSFVKEVSHRYTVNGFVLHRLPVPKLGNVLALVGTNGIGKSTALKILAGLVKPNLGDLSNSNSWMEVLKRFRGSELYGFFSKVLGGEIRGCFKEQYVDNVPRVVKKAMGKSKVTVRDCVMFYYKDCDVGVCKSIVIEKGTRYQREKDEKRANIDSNKKFNIYNNNNNNFNRKTIDGNGSNKNINNFNGKISDNSNGEQNNINNSKNNNNNFNGKISDDSIGANKNIINNSKNNNNNFNGKISDDNNGSSQNNINNSKNIINSNSSVNLKSMVDDLSINETTNDDIPLSLISKFTLTHILDRDIDDLSGGELQRLAILITCLQKSDIYFFDEPSSYLDIKQRLTMAGCIRNTLTPQNYIVCVEHDLAICDLMSDYGCVLYGQSSAYGVITAPFSIKQAINVFLEGYVPGENMRFRSEALKFNVAERPDVSNARDQFEYTEMKKTYYHKEKNKIESRKDDNLNKEVKNKDKLDSIEPRNYLDKFKKDAENKDNQSCVEPTNNDIISKKSTENKDNQSDVEPANNDIISKKSTENKDELDSIELSNRVIISEKNTENRDNQYGVKPTNNVIISEKNIENKNNQTDAVPNKIFIESNEKNTDKLEKPAFELKVSAGHFSRSEIIVFMGENGTGKSTFIGLISGLIKPNNETNEFPPMSTSIKPQKIVPKYKGTVRDLFMSKIRNSFLDPSFINDVIKPLEIQQLYTQNVNNLSGGELQRVAITMCLGRETDIYLIDEPSAFLDADQRIAVCKVIKRFIYNRNKTAFVVEHDLIMGTYLADKIVVFKGIPGKYATASEPMDLEKGMNMFLENLGVTFRRDTENKRPRVNKTGSTKDREQKESGRYFFA